MDIVILLIIGLSVVYGIYHGFLHTVLSVGATLAAVVLAMTFGPVLSDALQNNQGLTNNLITFTDAVARVGDASLAGQSAADLTEDQVNKVIDSVGLPAVMGDVLRNNLHSGGFRGLTTVNEVVSRTLVSSAIRVLSYVAVFAASAIVLSLVTGLIAGVAKFPVLKAADFLAGGLFGLARGAVIVYVIFLLLPVVSMILPEGMIQGTLEGSTLAGLFSSDGFFVRVIQGRFM